MSRRPTAPAWLPLASLLIVGTGFAIGLSELWPLLHRQWTEINDYNHGYLMLAMAAWLGWRAWHADPPDRLAPAWIWLLPLTAILVILLLMELVFLNVPRLYLLPLLLIASIGLAFGREATQRTLWPALLLYFALPVWEPLAGHLQALTTRVSTFLLELAAIPVYIEGNFVHLPAGSFVVAEGCSGLNYLIVGMSLAAFYGLAFLHTWRSRILLFSVAVVVTLLANWLRVYVIILAGYLSDMQHYLVAVDHIVFGWVLFAVMLAPVLLCAGWLERGGRARGASGIDEPASRVRQPLIISSQVPMLAAAAICAILLMLPGTLRSVGISAAPEAEELFLMTADGAVRQPPALGWQPVFIGGQEDRASYVLQDQMIDVYRVLYPQQNREARLIRYRHNFTGEGWRPIGRQIRTLQLGDSSLRVIEHKGYSSGQEVLIWAWYEVGGRQATSNLGVTALELAALVRGRRDAAAVAVASVCWPDCESTAAVMLSFLRANAPRLAWPPIRVEQM